MAKKMQLDKLLDGALNTMFNREISRVASNIYDANTSPTTKRQITIKLIIEPDEERQIGKIQASIESKLCAAKSVNGKFIFGFNTQTKEGEASELKSGVLGQMSLEDAENEIDGEITGNVIDLRKKEGAM